MAAARRDIIRDINGAGPDPGLPVAAGGGDEVIGRASLLPPCPYVIRRPAVALCLSEEALCSHLERRSGASRLRGGLRSAGEHRQVLEQAQHQQPFPRTQRRRRTTHARSEFITTREINIAVRLDHQQRRAHPLSAQPQPPATLL
jgi:hypothetical protein